MRNIVVGTAGHIDHGKSALVIALTGSDPDRLKEEKARGITIDLGFANYQDGDLNVAFVDLPGHERFIRNMLAGVSGVDAVALVVAADESVMPQTREHFDICRLLGVRAGVVVLTKVDLVDDETLELVKLEVRELVADSFLEEVPMIPVSVRSGFGLNELRMEFAGLANQPKAAGTKGILRLPVDRTFSVKGFGTVATGTLVAGSIQTDMTLEAQPVGRQFRVRGLQVHGEMVTTAKVGQRVAVNLSGSGLESLTRGDVLVQSGELESTRCLDVTLELVLGSPVLKHGSRVRFHCGTSEVMARVSLAALTDAGPRYVEFGALESEREAYGRIRLEEPVPLTRGDRFVLRKYSPMITIGGGRVLDPAPGRGRLRSNAGVKRLSRLGEPDDCLEYVVAMVEDAGGHGLARSSLTPRGGINPDAVKSVVDRLVAEGRVVELGSVLVIPERLAELHGLLLGWVAKFHEHNPLEVGLPREEARERFTRQASSEVFDCVIERLVCDGELTARGHLALSSHRVSLSQVEIGIREQLENCYRLAALSPPELSTVVTEINQPRDTIERVLKLLLREEVLFRVENLVFHREALARLKDDIASLKADQKSNELIKLDVSAFKSRFSISRKFAIPLLGYLDKERVTRRSGDIRVLL
jgi:selenocysteine-specific elongation factor